MFAFQFKKVCSKKGMLGLISQICKAMEGSSDLLPDVIWAAGRWGRLLSRCRILAYTNSFMRNHESGKNFAFGESTFVNLCIGETLIFLFLPRKRLSSRNYRHQAEEILNSGMGCTINIYLQMAAETALSHNQNIPFSVFREI